MFRRGGGEAAAATSAIAAHALLLHRMRRTCGLRVIAVVPAFLRPPSGAAWHVLVAVALVATEPWRAVRVDVAIALALGARASAWCALADVLERIEDRSCAAASVSSEGPRGGSTGGDGGWAGTTNKRSARRWSQSETERAAGRAVGPTMRSADTPIRVLLGVVHKVEGVHLAEPRGPRRVGLRLSAHRRVNGSCPPPRRRDLVPANPACVGTVELVNAARWR